MRLCYRKRTFELRSQNDRILLHSRLALLLACHAVKFYLDRDAVNGALYEAHAVRLLTEKEAVIAPNVVHPMPADTDGVASGDEWVD